MNPEQAKELIQKTFKGSFHKDRFGKCMKELLHTIEEKTFTYPKSYIKASYSEHIQSMERIGKYEDEEASHEVDILIVRLKKERSLERARSLQRNYIASYLNGSRGGKQKDAALVAFVAPNSKDWRFSLIKMEYNFLKNKEGKVKVKEEFTPARRWSFLVGENENSHTVQSRLLPMLEDHRAKPTLEAIEEIFDIEQVTKEFFLKYRELFLRVTDELNKILKNRSDIKDVFKEKNIDSVDFAKKLLGQIVFLYFLQKKGWFGVKLDSNWGSGSKGFLRELFEKKHKRYKNFFDDILQPLFYEALRLDRSHDDHYYKHFNCKIPFLNGGLFDPIGDYSWTKTKIQLPNELFSNQDSTKEGDIGDGILDIFDRYNFTVREDEPLEKEVAIDPELLGKTYEKFNAIRSNNYLEFKSSLKSKNKNEENKFNKKFGVYYTPHEIVYYMCQQSLLHYISTALGTQTSKKDIEQLLRFKGQWKELENTAELKKKRIAEGKQTSSSYENQLPESIQKNAHLIDKALEEITICDPAVGSGAFPVGMMNEIVELRQILSLHIKESNPKAYELKRSCIENSLYGVDIDQGAVEITKLRLWLSLIVDEDDIKNIKPLPNLDYKVVCGNSLLSLEKDLMNYYSLEKLNELKRKFFSETNPTKKQEDKAQIKLLISELSEGYKKFDFELYFSEIFLSQRSKGGFDIVIANPPYVQLQKLTGSRLQKAYKKEKYTSYTGTGDVYCLFYERGVGLLAKTGNLCYITSNSWMRANYGKGLRTFLKDEASLKQIIDLGSEQQFESATVNTNILLCGTKEGTKEKKFHYSEKLPSPEDRLSTMSLADLSSEAYTLVPPDVLALKKKIEKIGTPLKDWDIKIYRGITTGYNEAFIITTQQRKELIQADPKSAKIIKPILRGRDIHSYQCKWDGLWLLFIPWHFPLHENPKIQGSSKKAENKFSLQYPAIYNHLSKYKKALSERNKDETGIRYEWYALQRCANTYYNEFEKEKIIYPNMTKFLPFAYNESGLLANQKCFIITGSNLKYLIAYLNSRLFKVVLKDNFPMLLAGTRELSKIYFENLPIPKIAKAKQAPFVSLVDKILEITQAKDYSESSSKQSKLNHLKAKIDQLVYQLYDLSSAEIELVAGQ